MTDAETTALRANLEALTALCMDSDDYRNPDLVTFRAVVDEAQALLDEVKP